MGNKHKHSDLYVSEFFGEQKFCNKKNCKGLMIPVLTRYEDHGPINYEYECVYCGKIIKDRVQAEKRRLAYEERKKNRNKNWNNNNNQYNNSRNRT